MRPNYSILTLTNTKKLLLVCHVLSLLTGGLLYVIFRADTLRMFEWFELARLDFFVYALRDSFGGYSESLPNWILFSLPDGLWVFSFVTLMLLIWDTLTLNSLKWFITVPLFAFGSEIGQLLNLLPGTFDSLDLTFYALGTVCPFMIYQIPVDIKFSHGYEK